ncbi:MAG: acyltransferase, partial [Bacteroidales bacterium]|nr:acyltransferase [Bacteroidales bacterium]
MQKSESWYKGKVFEIFSEVFFALFSFEFIKACLSSFLYYLHEHVIWRKKINTNGHNRIHARTSIRNAQNVYLSDNVRITMDCCIWAGDKSKIIFGNNVLVGPGVKMFGGNHGIVMNGVPMVYQ